MRSRNPRRVGCGKCGVRGFAGIVCVAVVAALWFLHAERALCGEGSAAAPPSAPDLDVTYIERTPRYVPGPWVYPKEGPQYLGIEEKRFTAEELKGKHKQWPAQGEEVTFTAHVANKSAVASPPTLFAWTLDGKRVAGGKLPAIQPWKETTQTYRWKWDANRHAIGFQVDTENVVKEICEQNNALEDPTDALTFQMRVTPDLYEAWHTKPNGMGSYSFEDWVQRHVKIMNGVLAGSVYPKTAPAGILERVRVDEFVVMSKEEMTGGAPQPLGFDGGWNYYDDNFGKEGSWFDFHIQDTLTDRIDTGLIHELTHQIGIIDMYCIVVGPHWNHVRDEDGDLTMIGYGTRQPGMMGGGGPAVDFDGTVQPTLFFTVNADGNVTVGETGTFVAYSEETAGALNAMRGLRRGHFGLYLFDLPAENFVEVLDREGKPVAGASITVYQQDPQPGPQSIPDKPSFEGTTDSKGVFALGKAPFGNVNCIGLNGTLFFVIRSRGQTEHHLLDVCHFNIAKWRGSKDRWTAVFQTLIPAEGAPQPPQNLRWGVVRWNAKPVLRWEPSPSANVKEYNVYRQRSYGSNVPCGLNLTFDAPYVKVATVPAPQTTCEVEPFATAAGATDTPWFTVTAVDDKGRESACAKNKDLVRWGPVGTATVERDDPKTVKVTLPAGAASVQAHNVFVVTPGTRLSFRVRTESSRAAALRLSVAAIGDVDLPLSTLVPAGTNLSDGQWHTIEVNLRERLDRIGSEKNVTPAQARSSWNEDWLVVACQFGDWTGTATEEAVFYIEGLQVTPR